MYTASEVAKYLVWHFRANPISNLKLQKLLYYCQGWELGISEKPLFGDPIQAWVHGPVVPTVFQEYRQFRWSPISPTGEPGIAFEGQTLETVHSVLDGYGKFTALQLERLSHDEDPWKMARNGIPIDQACSREISQESMKKYFGSR